MDSFIAADD